MKKSHLWLSLIVVAGLLLLSFSASGTGSDKCSSSCLKTCDANAKCCEAGSKSCDANAKCCEAGSKKCSGDAKCCEAGKSADCCAKGTTSNSSWNPALGTTSSCGTYSGQVEYLNLKQAEEIAQSYVEQTEGTYQLVGNIVEKDNVFEVSVVAEDNSLLDKLEIDKATAQIRPLKP